jgi:hypothetical protein
LTTSPPLPSDVALGQGLPLDLRLPAAPAPGPAAPYGVATFNFDNPKNVYPEEGEDSRWRRIRI